MFTAVEYYTKLLELGVDCDQDLFDAMLGLCIYMLQARYGDNWRAYATPNLCMAYDMMTERKRQSQVDEEEDQSVHGSDGSHRPPPGKKPA